MEKSTCSMFVMWDGAWETVAGNLAFCGAKTRHVKFDSIVTFTHLLEKAYYLTQVNREEYDIEMTMWAKHESRSLVVPVMDDDDVEQLVHFNTENRCSVPLCLVLKKKVIYIMPPPQNAQEKESHNSNTHAGEKGSAYEAGLGLALLAAVGSAELAAVGSTVWNVNHVAAEEETCGDDIDNDYEEQKGDGEKKAKVEDEKPVEEQGLESSGDAKMKKDKNETEGVTVGPKTFRSSVEIFDYFYKLLHAWPANLNLNKYEHILLLDLLKKGHLESERKIGKGVKAFQVRNHPQFKSRCFFLTREDQTVDDFCFRKCVDHILPLPGSMQVKNGVNKALRGKGGGCVRGRGRGGR